MKKIGIITFHRAHNYGAVLQTYALRKKLLQNNDEVKVIDYYNSFIYRQYKLFPKLRKNIYLYAISVAETIKNYRGRIKRINGFNDFIKDNFNLTKKYTDFNINKIKNEKFTHIITGSDQVWNIDIVGELSDIYTLNFLPQGIKKISYAASIGSAEDIKKYSKLYKSKIMKIDRISVREESAQKALGKIIKKDINVTIDPTLLLKKNEWEEELHKIKKINCNYILTYVVEPNQEFIRISNNLAKVTGLGIMHFGEKNPGFINETQNSYSASPLEFVRYIKDAEYVVTTSFHATVFSIIFNKKFWVIPHKKTGERVRDLLRKLGLENRAVDSLDEFQNRDIDEKINWDEVNEKLEIERQKSIDWLYNAIEN